MRIRFYEIGETEDSRLKFAVIISRYAGKWVMCRHRERTTYEIPGGHREPGETILAAAERELQEETGAREYRISPVCVYSVTGKNRVNQTGEESFGMLYYADIESFETRLYSEMESVHFFEELPENWTYPQIQPRLIEEYCNRETKNPNEAGVLLQAIPWRKSK